MKKLLIVLLLLSGCSGAGPAYSTVGDGFIKPHSGMAKLIIYRESNLLNISARYWVELNGSEVCKLHNGSFLMKDVRPGSTEIASSNFGSYGTSRLTIDTKPGQVIYVKMEINTQRAMTGVLGGMIANAIDEGVSENNGPVYLGVVNPESAKAEMASMNLDCT